MWVRIRYKSQGLSWPSFMLCLLVVYIDPGRALAGTLDGFSNEEHTAQTVVDGRVAALRFFAGFDTTYVGDGVAVDVRERFVVAFRVTTGEACRASGVLAGVGTVGTVDLRWLAVRLEDKYIGFHLVPLKTSFGAIDADIQVVLFASSNLRAGEDSLRTVLHTQQYVSIIIELATRYKRSQ